MLRWPEGEESVFAAVHTCLPRVVARRCPPPRHAVRLAQPPPERFYSAPLAEGAGADVAHARPPRMSASCRERWMFPTGPALQPVLEWSCGMKQPAGLPLSWFSRQNTGQEQTCVLLVKPGVRGFCVRSHKLIQ